MDAVAINDDDDDDDASTTSTYWDKAAKDLDKHLGEPGMKGIAVPRVVQQAGPTRGRQMSPG
eukprot:scaffold34609_cov146-Amphora_coffeaeformis.AAC.7